MIFDGGVFGGRNPKTGESLDPSQLKNSISLFCSMRALFDDMHTGNAETLLITQQNPALIPLAVINPLQADPKSKIFTTLKSQGAKAFLFAPALQYWTYDQFNFKECVIEAAKTQLPLQFMIATHSDLNRVVEAVKGLKNKILIRCLKGGGYSFLTDFLSVGRKYKNFYFDISTMVLNAGISHFVEELGAHRLYRASNEPMNIGLCSELLVNAVFDLKNTDKSQILGGSLSKIFSKKVDGKSEIPASVLKEIQRPKIDTHWHSDGWDILEPAKGMKAAQKYCDHFGYRALCFSSISALNYDIERGNSETFDSLKIDSRFFAYVVVDPLRVKDSLKLLDRYKKHLQFLGIKTIQDYYGLKLSDKSYLPILEWAQENQSVVMAHLPGMADAALKFPKVSFIAAHATLDRISQLEGAQQQIPSNIYLDIATSHHFRTATSLKQVIEKVGEDRVLFSVDGPLMSPAWTIGKMIDAQLSEATKQKIYYQNALTLLPNIRAKLS